MRGDQLRVGDKIMLRGKLRTVKKVHKWVREADTNQPVHRGIDFEECNNCGITVWAKYTYEEVPE